MASTATVGSAVIKLKFDGKDVKSELNGIEKDVESSSHKWGESFKRVGKIAAASFATASAAATAMVVSITKSAVKGFAEYEQLVGGIDTLFKDSSDIVQNYASQAYKTAQISANQYMETVTSFSASLLQGLGGDTKKAAEMANKAVIDMADNSNKMGTSMEMIQSAYQGFAKQNYTMLDNLKLGYGGTAGEMARLINDSGVLGNTMKVTAATVNSVSFDKMVEAIHVVQENMGITGTSALEASQTVQGSINSMKSAWSDLVTGLANENADLGKLIENFVVSAGTAIGNLVPVIFTALEAIANAVDELVPAIFDKLPSMLASFIPKLVDAISGLVVAFAEALPTFVQALINGIGALLNALTQNLPTILNAVTNALIEVANVLTKPENLKMMLNAALQFFMQLVKCLPDIIVALINALPTIIDNIIAFLTDPETIQMLIEAAVQLFMGLVMAVPQILGGILQAFGTLVGNIWDGITQMFGEFAGNFGEFIGDIFKNAINGVLTFIENFVNLPIDALNGFIWLINQAFGWIGVDIGYIDRIQLPRLAQGGFVDGATTAMIGEDGAEAVLPLENNTDNWAGLLAQTLVAEMEIENVGRAGVTIEKQEFIINNEMDAQDIGRVMMQSIRRSA